MLLLTGLCHGFKANTRKVGNNEFTDNLILLEVQDKNQYGIDETKTVGIKLSKADVEAGLQHLYDQLKGKALTVPVRVVPWASKAGNAGYDFWLSGDRKPVQMQIKPPAAAVQAAS